MKFEVSEKLDLTQKDISIIYVGFIALYIIITHPLASIEDKGLGERDI